MSFAAGPSLAFIPSPPQGVWHLGPIPIRAYALCIIVGIIVAIWWGERRLQARGGMRGTVVDIAVWAVPFGLVGGRAYHVATDWWRYFGSGDDPIGALKIWDGGLGIPGAIALGGVGAWIGCRRKGIPLPFFADAVAPGIVTAQGIGRLGNYFNQELFGGPTTLPWGLEIAPQFRPAGYARYATFQPTFLYMSSSSTWHWPPPWSGWAITAPSGRPGCSRCTSPGTRRSGCSRSRCAPTLPSTSSGCG